MSLSVAEWEVQRLRSTLSILLNFEAEFQAGCGAAFDAGMEVAASCLRERAALRRACSAHLRRIKAEEERASTRDAMRALVVLSRFPLPISAYFPVRPFEGIL